MSNEDDARTLRWIEGFRELSAHDVKTLSASCRWRWYKPGQRVFSQDDQSRDVFFVVQGKVRITLYSMAGREISFRDLTVGEVFGDLAAIDGRPRSASAVALSDALLASMPRPMFWDMVMRYPAVAAASLKRLAGVVRALSDRVVEYSVSPVGARIRLELLRLARQCMRGPNRAEIAPAPTHVEIAARVATHREAVTRELQRLTKVGTILRTGRTITVPDVRALELGIPNEGP